MIKLNLLILFSVFILFSMPMTFGDESENVTCTENCSNVSETENSSESERPKFYKIIKPDIAINFSNSTNWEGLSPVGDYWNIKNGEGHFLLNPKIKQLNSATFDLKPLLESDIGDDWILRYKLKIDTFEQALCDSGLALANIETLRGWASPNKPSEQCLATESTIWEIADRFHCRYVQVIGNYTGTLEQAAEGFASLCDRASEHGLLVGLEAVPEMTNIENLVTASEIVERSDRENGGLCFDSWHLTRSTNDIEDISKIPEGKIFATQWNDGPAEKVYDDYYTDTLGTRVPPGDGQFLLKEMLDAIQAANCIAPVGLEVPSTSLWTAPIDQAALASITGMKNIMGLL